MVMFNEFDVLPSYTYNISIKGGEEMHKNYNLDDLKKIGENFFVCLSYYLVHKHKVHNLYFKYQKKLGIKGLDPEFIQKQADMYEMLFGPENESDFLDEKKFVKNEPDSDSSDYEDGLRRVNSRESLDSKG